MKFERINSTDYLIYDYSSSVSENTIISDVKDIFQRIQSLLSLKGFYRVTLCVHKIGLFFQVHQLEDAFYKDTLDLKIEISSFDIYYCTEDYFLIKSFSPLRYLDGKYYCKVDDFFDKILEKVEFGDFVFGDRIVNILKKSILIQ